MQEFAALTRAIDDLAAADPQVFSDPESVVELHRQLARLEAVVTRCSAGFEASGVWADDGARSALSWVSTSTRLPKSTVRRRLRLGRQLRSLPVAEAAWLAGEIADSHVDALARMRSARTEEALGRDEEELVGHARELPFSEFSRVLSYWAYRADPDGAEQAAEAQRDSRDAYLEQSFGGMYFGRLSLDPISGTIVRNELEAIYEELFAADWAGAKERLDRDPTVFDLGRSPGQRRADAFVEMATRSASAHPLSRPPRALFTVVCGEARFRDTCELSNRTVVTPGSLAPHVAEADIERVMFKSPTRAEVGERTRLFKGATRRAVEVRDGECAHPFCDKPAEQCQVDHIVPFSQGGLTTQENGRLLCEFHNRLEFLRNQRPPPPAA
jgi:hypothetical protein